MEHWTGKPFFVWKLLSWLSKERIRIVEDLKGSWKTGTTCKQHMLNTSNTYYYYYFCYFHVYPLFSKTCVGDLEAFNGHQVKLWIMIGSFHFLNCSFLSLLHFFSLTTDKVLCMFKISVVMPGIYHNSPSSFPK